MNLSTPLHLSLLIHYHCRCDEYATRGAPAVEEYIGHLLRARLIRKRRPDEVHPLVTAQYRTTIKGSTVVNELCAHLGKHYTDKIAKAIFDDRSRRSNQTR